MVRPAVRPAHSDLVVVPRGAPRPDVDAPVAFVEVVARRADRERGLGGRDRLDPDHGMLFVYAQASQRRFWMRGCKIALDIAFLREDGTIAYLATLPPESGDEPLAETEFVDGVRWALEMEAGWFAAHGLRAGGRVDVSEAVRGVEAD